MYKRVSKSPNYLVESLKLIGKPIFLLITFLGVFLISYLHLIKIFTQRIFSFHPPRFRITLPPVRLPKVALPCLKFNKLIIIPLSFTFILSSIGALFYWYILYDLPSPYTLTSSLPNLSTKIYDRNGELLYKIYQDENRTLIHLSDLPPYLIQATIAAEDKNFYHHHGLDFSGIFRATRNNIICYLGRVTCYSSLQGGSTLTQQLVKNTLLTPEKTLRRKLREAVLALWTERVYNKDQILELYLNHIPYGGTSYGIQEAAQEFFGKDAKDLTLAESTLLTGLPVAPTSLSPFGLNPYLSKIRQTQVLESMVKLGYISENDKVASISTPISFHPKGDSIKAPHFVMYIKSLLVKKYGEEVVERGGLEVTTTLDLAKQQILENSIGSELAKLKNLRVNNGAGMIINPGTGEILAMAGSRDFFDTDHDGQVNVTLMPRQPGSSIKPITYALAMLSGLNPDSRIEDSPVCFRLAGQPDYCPKNYDGRFHGSVTLRTALASSYNVPAIKLLNSLGINNLVSLAKRMGITTWDDSSRFGLSLTLGGGEVTMYDLAEAYAVFANSGTRIPLTAIKSITSPGELVPLAQENGVSVKAIEPQETRVIPDTVAHQITSILSDPIARAPAFGLHSLLNIPGHTVAVKTGTTNNLRDNWTIGYTKDYLVATWVGNNDNTPMSSVASGITGASPIWASVMKQILPNELPHSPKAKTL